MDSVYQNLESNKVVDSVMLNNLEHDNIKFTDLA